VKGDREKVRIARRLRAVTTVSLKLDCGVSDHGHMDLPEHTRLLIAPSVAKAWRLYKFCRNRLLAPLY
jgi:hypothetical protein